MDDEKKALTWQEFVDSGFDGRDYQFALYLGVQINAGLFKHLGCGGRCQCHCR